MRVVLTNDLNFVASQSAGVHSQSGLDQVASVDRFSDAGNFGIALLHADNVFDVLDMFGEFLQFGNGGSFLGHQMGGQLSKVNRDWFGPGIRAETVAQISL